MMLCKNSLIETIGNLVVIWNKQWNVAFVKIVGFYKNGWGNSDKYTCWTIFSSYFEAKSIAFSLKKTPKIH